MPKPALQVSETNALPPEELRQFVEQYRGLEDEKAKIAEAMKDVMAEAKGRGYDTKVLKKLIAEMKRDPDDVAEENAILDLYREALGMATGGFGSGASDGDLV